MSRPMDVLVAALIALPALCAACAAPGEGPQRPGSAASAAPAARCGPVRMATVYAPHRIDPARNPQLYAMTVTAASDAEAVGRHAAARAAGPGRPVPPGVVVDAWLELDGLSRLRSSLTGRFAVFRLTVDGETVADLLTGLNVVPEDPGHGWSTLRVDLPAGLAVPGTPLQLVQRREGADADLELVLDS